MFENRARARYLADPEHHGVLRDGLYGEHHDLLQAELDLMRKHSAISLERLRAIENEMKRGTFALVDEEGAPSKASKTKFECKSLISLVQRKRKQRTKVAAQIATTKQISLAATSHLIYKQ
jgi:hypothetical protein